MPNYELFGTVYYRQTDDGFRAWLLQLRDEYNKAAGTSSGGLKICEKTARASYDAGETAHQCLSEKHND